MATQPRIGERLLFDGYELDVHAGELRKHGLKLRLRGQPLRVLEILLEHAGEVVTREEIQSRIWPANTFVDFDHSLHNAIARIREVLGRFGRDTALHRNSAPPGIQVHWPLVQDFHTPHL